MAICTLLAQKICDILIAVRRLDRSSKINVKLQEFCSCKRFLIDGKVDLSGGGLSIKGNQLGDGGEEVHKVIGNTSHFSSIFGTK